MSRDLPYTNKLIRNDFRLRIGTTVRNTRPLVVSLWLTLLVGPMYAPKPGSTEDALPQTPWQAGGHWRWKVKVAGT